MKQQTEQKNYGWGTWAGKAVALCLVLAFVFGTIALCRYYERNRGLLLKTNEIMSATYSEENNTVTMKFKVDKKGYSFSGYDSYINDEDEKSHQLVLRLYASIVPDEEYTTDEEGFYTLVIPCDKTVKTIAQEGEDEVVSNLYNIKD